MNAERLLALYEKVAEAPDAIARLRRFVLDLAVRGKLVAQDAGDEPAPELLKRIAVEKARLEDAGKARRSKDVETQSKGNPFVLPDNWAWTTLQKLARARMGKTILSKELTDAGLPVFSAGMENRPWGYIEASDVIFSRGTIVISARGGIGYPKLPDFDQFVSTQTTIACECFDSVVAPYLCLVLEVLPDWLGMKSQTAIPMITVKQVHGIPIPLPPLAEQRRIVAKVEELMALLDRLEAARTAREANRDRLTAASLNRLTAPDTTPEVFPAHARFALGALPALTARRDQIKSLRQTILNLAVRGKLVEQDPNDEPLRCIDNGVYPDAARPFGIPAGWQWSRLRSLGELKGGGTPSKARDDFWNGNVPWVSPKDMKVKYIDAAQLSITDSAIAGSAVSLIEPESVLFVVRGMILAHSFPVAISRVPLTINQDMKAIVLRKPEMAEYILLALKGLTPEMLARVQRSSHGTCRIEGADYGDFLIPLPPLAEQHRIVAKVDELMTLCDRLEAALATTDTTKQRLLETLLREALDPTLKEAA